jgi:hypothetical protein
VDRLHTRGLTGWGGGGGLVNASNASAMQDFRPILNKSEPKDSIILPLVDPLEGGSQFL